MDISINDINIRTEYQSGDIGEITLMHGRNYDFGIHFEAYVARTLADFYTRLDPKKECYWIAEYKGTIVGHIALKNTEGWAQLRYFLIREDYRGIGLGKKLMNCFMDFMKKAGYSRAFLLTEHSLKTAAYLYGHYGFEYVSSNLTDYGLEERRYEMFLD